MRRLAILLAALLANTVPSFAHASAITPLDTFPTNGGALGPAYPVFAMLEWQSIAIPFHLAAPGTITEIETGFFIPQAGGDTAFAVGIATGPLLGQTDAQLNSVYQSAICPPETFPTPCANQFRPDIALPPNEMLDVDLSLYLAAGDYWLYVRNLGDNSHGAWYTNPNLLSDAWAINSSTSPSGLSYLNSVWTSVADYGPSGAAGGAYAMPVARISVDPGKRVPEPATIGLLGMALMAAVLMKSRLRCDSNRDAR